MIEQLESEFQFTYPELYKQLYNDQMLDWNRGWNEPWTKERNWSTEIYPKLKEYPPLLLHCDDFELTALSDVAEYINNKPDYWDQQHKFIPFATSGSGDWFAFYYNLKEGNNVPIAFVSHDMDEVTIMAAKLSDFIFRKMLEMTYCTGVKNAEEEKEFRSELNFQLASHRRYLSAEKVALLESVYNLPINEYKHVSLGSGEPYSEYGIFTLAEINSLLKEHIGFPLLEHTFSHHVQNI
jgi:hypothetical protein